MDTGMCWEKDGYLLRPARAEDAGNYYRQNFCPLDPEVARLTGSRRDFSRAEVTDFFLAGLDREDRRHFLLIAPDGQIAGESVLLEIDRTLRCAGFRIALFRRALFGRGLGTWMARMTCGFAFRALGLHRVALEVFSFNPRAEAAYRKLGFRREGVLRDAVMDGGRYADVILMAVLEEEWDRA